MHPEQNDKTARLEQASLWWLRLREADVRPEEISEWLAWCQSDPANLEAFEKIDGLGVRLDNIDPAARDTLMREVLDERPAAAPRKSAARRRHWALAAGLAAVAMISAFVVHRVSAPPAIQNAVYTTAKAQLQDLKLSDGSKIALGADTRLDVAYSAELRDLQLGDGEAYFEVAHNSARPFVVHVGHLSVTAVGTAFNIRKTGERVEVIVTQGVVDVAGGSGVIAAQAAASSPASQLPGSGVIRVPAGQLIISENRSLTVRPADEDAAIAWRKGSQRFVDENLGVVVANLNRYSQDEVVIADPSLATLRYTGTVVEGHEAEWLAAIEKVFPVAVRREASGRIALHRRLPMGAGAS
ncbi:FecR family protein [Solimonas terrae]|uniref:DUF4880 domain-containing protein n=1 Tax=Solimonas terrae TaxID=1396819 RepID=A0A6M2BY17_9GAMM|nr:FecR domain-containing protein [Solimonas terrae]NGY06717.1 DUF4880 domain-containing protein [Solimonas terrae]